VSENIEMVKTVAHRLGDLREDVVFLGGAVLGLLITDPAASEARPTKDVDLIVDIASRAEYADLETKLRAAGFLNDRSQGAPVCRWLAGDVKVDVMPTDPALLGFGNRWYARPSRTPRRERSASGASGSYRPRSFWRRSSRHSWAAEAATTERATTSKT
jgi:hypothetical protein